MIKQFPDDLFKQAVLFCDSLSFHGDVIYIGGKVCVTQYNVVTESVARLEGYTRLSLFYFCYA